MKEVKYWFTLDKDVYVSFNSLVGALRASAPLSDRATPLLLYHTKTGKSFITSNQNHIDLVNEVYNPVNLGVVDMETYPHIGDDVLEFIDKTTQLGIGKIIEKTSEQKPLNFLPILNLQNDIERLQQTNQEFLIGDKINQYLSSVTLAINSRCEQNCDNCEKIYRQFPSCSRFYGNTDMPLDVIKEILQQSSFSNVKRVNILGGNILLYPQWDVLLDFLKEQDFSYHLFLNFNQLRNVDDLLQLPFHKEINIGFPFDESALFELLESTRTRDDFSYNFVIESMLHYEKAGDIINKFNLNDCKILPLYNGENMDFFEENVFLSEDDILAETIEMRKIFCNQKLNANFFGSLIFLPDGTVKANVNTPAIGKFPDETILQLIYTELTSNTAWRKIRSGSRCDECIYRYLCPPVSAYEMVLERENLCTFAT